ncbi:MAG: hypothetical protein IT234_02185 [Bacteroidia bacterium]|nr:hypothetical protein [Bacteroidia bacterium]
MSNLQKLRIYLYSFTHNKQWKDWRARITGKDVPDITKTYYGSRDRKTELAGPTIFIKPDGHTISSKLILREIAEFSYIESLRHDVVYQIVQIVGNKPINECSFEEYLNLYWPFINQFKKNK